MITQNPDFLLLLETHDKLQVKNHELEEVILFGLSLIALAERFDIDLGQAWQNFKQKAKNAGVEYVAGEQR